MRKYGFENFSIEQIATAASEREMLDMEVALIAQYQTFGRNGARGYNLTRGGEGIAGAGIRRVVNGLEFDSLTDAAEYFGLDRGLVEKRLAAAWTLEQALELESAPYRTPSQSVAVEVNGTSYESLAKACEGFGIHYETVRHRLLRGWTNAQAFGLASPPPIAPTTGKEVVVDDQTFRSLSEACRTFRVATPLVHGRLASGWTMEQAFNLEPPPPRRYRAGRAILVSGMLFSSISAATKHFGINDSTVHSRILRGDLTNEQVFGLHPIAKKVRRPETFFRSGNTVVISGKTFRSNAAAARAYGLTPQKVHARMKLLGWTLEQALGVSPPPKNYYRVETKAAVLVGGVRYPSLAAACRARGVKYDRALQRIKKLGWSVEDALTD